MRTLQSVLMYLTARKIPLSSRLRSQKQERIDLDDAIRICQACAILIQWRDKGCGA